METRLQLLMLDGTLILYFRPKLTTEQYGALLEASEQWHTANELATAARALANEWGIEVEVDFA